METELKQALEDIKSVLEAYRGTYQEHSHLQQCYNKVLTELNKDKK